MQSYDEIEAEVRKLAHSLPPSDFGSTRAIQAVAAYVAKKLSDAQPKADPIYEAHMQKYGRAPRATG
jgi:hypothetical protein